MKEILIRTMIIALFFVVSGCGADPEEQARLFYERLESAKISHDMKKVTEHFGEVNKYMKSLSKKDLVLFMKSWPNGDMDRYFKDTLTWMMNEASKAAAESGAVMNQLSEDLKKLNGQ
ncbi:MAG: hypothetical protein PHQ23_16505 [Candidatus Wallbacteria bacterium]|nr:hypothetical protein [Candidatus Wallbacteria bacterium]